jgi:hypothetical protein
MSDRQSTIIERDGEPVKRAAALMVTRVGVAKKAA